VPDHVAATDTAVRGAGEAPRAATPRSRIVIEGAQKSFAGRRVVDIDHLVLGDHPVEGLIGPNGAGKTTFMRLVMGSLPLDAGRVWLETPDRDRIQLSRLPAHRIARHRVVKTNQVITDFDGLTILDSLLLAVTSASHERPFRLWGERALHRAHRHEIDRYLDHFSIRDPHRLALSAGEKKLVDIVRCLLLRPAVLLLDEPTAGLTGEMTQRVMSAVRDLADEGAAVVIIEHDLDVIWNLSAQVTFMAEGRVLLQGDPAEIRKNTTVIESYLGQGHV
jgi:ABC-type branched-subunit amino acid transport system ATPase component